MSAMRNSALNIMALGAAGVSALTTSPLGTKNGCNWDIAGLGSFNTQFNYSFTASVMSGALSNIISSTYTVAAGNSPLARRFDQANIGYDATDNAVTLTVPGGQSTGPISCSQIVTPYSDILFGSVRTVAKISGVAGTTHGFSFYASDTQEVDFAFLTSDTTLVHLTNEQSNATAPVSSYTYSAPSDATTAYHEYRVDWTASSTQFYIDDVLIKTITDNVPSTAGFWLWNNWSNGNAWAAGPPASDSVLSIQSINAYFNRTSVVNTGSCTTTSSNVAVVSSSSSSYTAAPTSTKTALCPTYNNTVYTTTDGAKYQVACGIDFAGGDFQMGYVSNLQGCMELCEATSGCIDVSLSGTACYMKNVLKPAAANSGVNAAKMIQAATS